MKNSSKKLHGKNNKEHKKNSEFGYYSKNTNRPEKDDKELDLTFLLKFSEFLFLPKKFFLGGFFMDLIHF